MRYLTLLEKLKILFDTIMAFKSIFILIIIMLILTILFIFRKISNKKYILFMSISMLFTLVLSIVKNYKVLANTFDDFTTIFFNGIYFPSIYIYIGILVIIALTFIISILSNKKKKIYKIINSMAFIINNIFFIIILNIIAKNNINVFEISSLYTNNVLVAMLELNVGLFILWLTILSITYITNIICDKITSKKVVNEAVISSEVENVTDGLEAKEELVVNEIPNKVEDNEIEDKVTFNDILNGLVPVTYYDNKINNHDYNISNPQEIYEKNYNNLKLELEKVPEVKITKVEPVIEESKTNTIKENINLDTVEDRTLKIKQENMKKNLVSNTISLNDLIKNDEEIKIVDKVINTIKEPSYTLEDYKKIIAMLKEIKNNSNKNNISIDDAVTMSLISNYSIDDCVKFKEILENNLN